MSEIELQGAIESAMAKLAEAEREAAEASALVTSTGRLADLAPDNAPDMKVELALRQHTLEQKRLAVVAASKELQKVMEARMDEVRAVLAPMQRQMALMSEGIKTLNLYLGRDESMEMLRDGEPADVTEPISIRQTVLSMDQESMLMASDGGMDFSDIPSFVKWMLADDANLDQMLPERRGVVCVVPRQGGKDYRDEDAWTASMKNAANEHTYWLIRNGERLYIMTTELSVGTHLVPKADEFTRYFETDRWGRPIKPGSHEWQEAEERADDRKRHFMKVAMVLQGLIDRTDVFHPIAPDISVLSMESYDDGTVRVVTDAERAIGSGLEPFAQWHARISSGMRAGMRVVFARNEEWRKLRSRKGDYDYEPDRLSIPKASEPLEGVVYTLETNRGGTLKFRYERTDKRWGYEHQGKWGRYGEWEYDRKGVSCEVIPGDRFVIPIDLVTIEEMQRYMDARTERYQYKTFWPLLTSAIEAKREEARVEAPFRKLLIGTLMQASGDDQETVEADIDQLIHEFKLGNRWHRALVGLTVEEQSKALRMICGEYTRRRQFRGSETDEDRFVAQVLNQHPEIAMITRKADGTYTTLEPQPGAERTNSVGVYWVKRDWTKTGKRKGAKIEWYYALPPKTRIIFETAVWTERNMTRTNQDALSGPELDAMVEQLVDAHGDDLIAIAWNQRRGWNDGDARGDRLTLFRAVTDPHKRGIGARDDARSVEAKTVVWKRTREGVAITYDYADRWWKRVMKTTVAAPWNGSTWDGKERHEVDFTVWVNPTNVAKWEERAAKVEHQEAVERRLHDQVRTALHRMEKVWRANWWEDQRIAFLAEYQGHEHLWEAHKATMKEPRWEHSWLRKGDPRVSANETHLNEILYLAIEGGIDIHGRTLRDVMGVLEHVGKLGGEYTKITFPDVLLDTTISIRDDDPEPEDDDDDEEYEDDGEYGDDEFEPEPDPDVIEATVIDIEIDD